ncbi:MAG: transposase, partial [Planctomycetaceae bacterium]|nr:transposase [Planctomycetaceae bacterium]
LFKRFDEELHKRGVLVKSGIIVDGTFVDVPKQDFSKDDYAQIKKGEKHDGYKNHVKANSDTKIITDYKVQKANNKLKSKTRSRIEHIFGAQKMRMGNEIL